MKKNIAISLIAVALFTVSFLSFHRSYEEMQYYSALTKQSVIVASDFQELSLQINNAAIMHPSLAKSEGTRELPLFYSDSLMLCRQLQKLNDHVIDTMNVRIARQLDTLVRAELSWLLKSNVPDSVLTGNPSIHLKPFKTIDVLIKKGIERTDYLFKYREQKLRASIQAVEWKVAMFLGFACILVLGASISFLAQRHKRLQKERELEQQEKKFRAMVEHNQDLIVVIDEHVRVLYRSPSSEKITGFTNEEHTRDSNLEEVHPEDKDKIKAYLADLKANPGKVIFATYRLKHKSGHYIWMEGTFSSLFHDPAIKGVVINVKDISERKAVEEELIKSEKRFRETLDNIMEGVQLIGFDWRYIYVNDALTKYSNYNAEQMIGHNVKELYPGVEQTALYSSIKACMKERKNSRLESEFVFPDGTKRHFDLSIQPVPEGIFILSVDISSRKKAEEEITQLNRLYAFISAINQSIVHIDKQEVLLKKACDIAIETGGFKLARIEMLEEDGTVNTISISGSEEGVIEAMDTIKKGYSMAVAKNTPVGKTLRSGTCEVNNDMQNDPALEEIREALKRVNVASGIALPIKRSGKLIGVFTLSSTQPGFFDRREIELLVEAAEDISFAIENLNRARLHKITEEQILNNEKRFRALIEKSTDMKTLTNRGGLFVYGSPTVLSTFGYTEEEFLNKPAFEFFHPNDIPDLLRKRTSILDKPGASFSFQYRALHKKGYWIWIEGTLTNMLHEPSVSALVSNFRDISEKKNAEEQTEKMISDLLRYSKNLEQFAYVVSHNLRSPVANILGLSNILKGELTEADRERSQEFLYKAVEQLDITVNDLNKILEVRTGTGQNHEEVNLKEVVEAIKISIPILLNHDVIFEIKLEIDSLYAIKSYVHSIFYNLITNSIKYRRKDVKLIIRIHSFAKDNKLYIIFSDNGTGLNLAQHGTKVFGLYQRFHLDISGKGMGLFMVKTQIEAMEGSISMKSSPGEGMEFTMTFPLSLTQ